LLEVIRVIEFATGDKEGTLWVDHNIDRVAVNQNVSVSRAIYEIHFVLEARAAPAYNSDAQSAISTALFLEKATKVAGCTVENLDEFFVSAFEVHC
jgi:hypothetical protein